MLGQQGFAPAAVQYVQQAPQQQQQQFVQAPQQQFVQQPPQQFSQQQGAQTSQTVQQLLERMQGAGVVIDDHAVQALSTLPDDHAEEIADYVIQSRAFLRNPSKYISSTVARGFVPRRFGGFGGKGGAPPPRPAFVQVVQVPQQAAQAPQQFVQARPQVVQVANPPAPAVRAGVPINTAFIPLDATPMENRILNINAGSPPGGPIDFATYLALRTVSESFATELLDAVEAKGYGGSTVSFLQASVSKVQSGQDWRDPGGGPASNGYGPGSGPAVSRHVAPY
ncbi:unnamed protein product [Prorocentrum cordatum]|uniref:Uncharacterized protein n=1 Tax=Prorocentrum cordatum TaxID=2364126 RepID=A0ABN9S4D7_9DINO|nr:unnamed protein product [Polarella glacialis]